MIANAKRIDVLSHKQKRYPGNIPCSKIRVFAQEKLSESIISLFGIFYQYALCGSYYLIYFSLQIYLLNLTSVGQNSWLNKNPTLNSGMPCNFILMEKLCPTIAFRTPNLFIFFLCNLKATQLKYQVADYSMKLLK